MSDSKIKSKISRIGPVKISENSFHKKPAGAPHQTPAFAAGPRPTLIPNDPDLALPFTELEIPRLDRDFHYTSPSNKCKKLSLKSAI